MREPLPRLQYTSEDLMAFNSIVMIELNRWWGRRYLAHWLPRIRLGLWMVAHLRIVMRCVMEEAERMRGEEGL